MNILAVNTAAASPEIALVKGSESAYFRFESRMKVTEMLLPQIVKMLNESDLNLSGIDYLGCVVGPGSFTGIRVGAATVRALSYATGIKCVPVTYFDVLTYNISPDAMAVIDGSNGICYVRYGGSDAVRRLDDALELRLQASAVVCDEVTAPMFGQRFTAGKDELIGAVMKNLDGAGDYRSVVPYYLRRSQAERRPGEL